MMRHLFVAWGDRRRYLPVAMLPLGAIEFTGILSFPPTPVFQPFFRNIPPLLAVSVISVLGVVSLCFLSSHHGFEMAVGSEGLNGVAGSSAFATMFAVAIVLADLVVAFPCRHVPQQQSLLFYPTMAYVAEIVFHILPLAILLALLGPICTSRDSTTLLWVCIILASCPEPIVQLSWRSSESPLSWVDVYVGLHVFAFNTLQLSMHACRLAYDIEWPIVWGYVQQYVLPVS